MGRMGFWEEIANSGLHGLGALLSLAGLGGLVAVARGAGDPRALGAAWVYGLSLAALYAASCLYHGAKAASPKPSLRLLDHIAIYLLIAGTYTPFCLLPLWGTLGLGLLAAVWALALLGIASELWFRERFGVAGVFLYLGMGWLAIVALRELYALLPATAFWLVVSGGALYTLGVAFFVLGRIIPFMHTVWHLFVLGASACHYVTVLLFVLPRVAR
ncbi:PAQR family membrane homeostasis protein TrhA [Candidatus Bipolaricaulota sp. J31]